MKICLTFFLAFPLLAAPHFYQGELSPKDFKPANHGSSIVAFSETSLLSCWYAGHHESARDVQIFCSRSNNKGRSWDAPQIAVKTGESARSSWFSNKTVGNVALYLDDENTLWMFYSAVVFGGWSGSHVDYKTSRDFGITWSQSDRLISSFGNLPKNKPIKISHNKFFLPLYHEFSGFQGYGCMLSIQDAQIKKSDCHDIPGGPHGQPSFVKKEGGKVFAYLRTRHVGKTWLAEFDLIKNLWTELYELDLPNPDSAVDAVTFEEGVLIAYNNSPTGRVPLSLVISKEGYHFKKIYDIETKVESAYPALIQRGSECFLTYTYNGRGAIKFVNFNSDWLRSLQK